ncbi:MAG: tetratricopeptide repeat protein [Bacteroidota bacterium]
MEDLQLCNALYEESKLLIEEEKYEEAVGFLEQAHEMYKGNTDYTYVAAYALYKLQKLEEAAKKIGWSLALEPFQSDYYVLAGNIAYKREDFEKGIEFYNKALQYQDSTEVAINELDCVYNRANCYLNLANYENAARDYSSVLSIDKENFMAFHNRGLARLKLGRTEQACADFDAAVSTGSGISDKYRKRHCE